MKLIKKRKTEMNIYLTLAITKAVLLLNKNRCVTTAVTQNAMLLVLLFFLFVYSSGNHRINASVASEENTK